MALTLAMVSRCESFDRAAVLLQSTPHPSPLPEERELVVTKTLLSPECRGEGDDLSLPPHSGTRPCGSFRLPAGERVPKWRVRGLRRAG